MNKKIKRALDEKGMTQKELADKLSVTPQAVSKWVNGESRPDSDNIARIKEILDIDLIECVVDANRKSQKSSNFDMKYTPLDELSEFEKCVKESELLISNSGISNRYSKPVIKLIEWLLPAVIGLTYHQFINGKPEDEIAYDNIYYNLIDYLDSDGLTHKNDLYENYLEYNFYLMGADLFDSFEPYYIKDHDLCNCSMSYWYKFQKALVKSDFSPIYCELLIAITDLADYVISIV